MSEISLDIALKVAEIVSVLGGGTVVAFRLGRTTQRVEAAMTQQGYEINSLRDEIKTLSKLITEVALQGQRLDMQDKRLDTLDRRYEELRHGEGFAFPPDGKLMGPRPFK
jgi:TolA-binding protein